ncbi:MAG: tetratricopeptide repeat-containing sensor histidine kinase [Ignavibacteria bacterium]
MENQISDLESQICSTTDQREKINLKNILAESIRPVNIIQSLEISNEVIELGKEISYSEGTALGYRNAGICSRLLSNYDDAFQYFEKALEIYNDLNDPLGKARVINSIGNIYLNLSDYKYSLEYLHKCLKIISGLNYKQFEASVLSNIGLAYQESGEYTSSLEYNLKSMQTYTNNNLDIPVSLLNNIGIVYQNLGDYTTSLEYFNSSLKLAEEIDNKLDAGFALGNISIVYYDMKNYSEALVYLNRSLKILNSLGNRQAEANVHMNMGKAYRGLNNYDKAIESELRALQINEEISDFSSKCSTLLLLGEFYFAMGKYDTAKEYYVKGLRLAQNIGDSINETEAYLLIGSFFSMTKNYAIALDNLSRALNLAEERNSKKDICAVHLVLYEVYKSTGNYEKAFEHHLLHFNIAKEIHNVESDRKLKSLSIQFQLQNTEKERKIALQEKEIFRLKNVELAEANDRLIRLNEDKNEFMGIAAHDLRNPLSGILSFSKKIRNNFDKYSKTQISEMALQMEIASEKMLKLISKLLDINILESGKKNFQASTFNVSEILEKVIFPYNERAKSKDIVIKHKCEENLTGYADPDALSQILENLVSNAVKFTFPGNSVYVNAFQNAESLRFEVKDGGPGLTEKDKEKLFGRFMRLSAQPTGNENSTGLGLSIAKKLTSILGGRIWCESVINEGASFIVEIPIVKNEQPLNNN